MCASLTPAFTAASAPASVELTSPATTQRSISRSRSTPLDADERFRRLLGVRPGADAEELVRRRQVELGEEDVRHLLVVVLARVHEHELERRDRAPPAPGTRGPTS